MAVAVQRYAGCGRIYFEAEGECARCGGALEERHISGRGRVYSYTEVHAAPAGMAPPYCLALIDLDGAGRVLGRLEGTEAGAPAVDAPVRFGGLSERGPSFALEVSPENSDGE